MNIRTFFVRILVAMTLIFVMASLMVVSTNLQSRESYWALTEAHQQALRWQEAREGVVQLTELGEPIPSDSVDMISALTLPRNCCERERALVLRSLEVMDAEVPSDRYRSSAAWEQLLRAQRLALDAGGKHLADQAAIRNWMIPGLSALVLAMVLLVSWSILKLRIIVPTEKLANHVNRLLRGRPSQNLNMQGVPTELVSLYEAFELTVGDYRGQLNSHRERSAEMSRESDLLEMQIQSLIEMSERPAFVVDVSGAIRTWNRQMISLTGLSKNHSLRSIFSDEFLDSQSREIFDLAMQTARLGKLPDEFRCSLILQGGRELPVAVQLSPQVEPGLGVNRILGIVRVEHEEVDNELAPMAKLASTDSALLAKIRKLGSAVHWIQGEMPERSDLELSRRTAALTTAINWLAQQRYERERSEVDALEILTHVGSILSPRCQDLDIRLETQIKAEHAIVSANAGALVEVLSAICENAIEAIEARASGARKLGLSADTRDGWLTLQVSDSGVGVRDHNSDHCFEPLFTTKAAQGSLGLGLTHAQYVVEGFGGDIQLTSTVLGQGCTVMIRLPVKSAAR